MMSRFVKNQPKIIPRFTNGAVDVDSALSGETSVTKAPAFKKKAAQLGPAGSKIRPSVGKRPCRSESVFSVAGGGKKRLSK